MTGPQGDGQWVSQQLRYRAALLCLRWHSPRPAPAAGGRWCRAAWLQSPDQEPSASPSCVALPVSGLGQGNAHSRQLDVRARVSSSVQTLTPVKTPGAAVPPGSERRPLIKGGFRGVRRPGGPWGSILTRSCYLSAGTHGGGRLATKPAEHSSGSLVHPRVPTRCTERHRSGLATQGSCLSESEGKGQEVSIAPDRPLRQKLQP